MNRSAALLFCGLLVFAGGCVDDAEKREDPTFEDADVQTPPIHQINPPFAGQYISISPFVNKTLAEYRALGDIAPDVLSNYAIESGFRVVESLKGQMSEVNDEANFQQTAAVDEGSAVKLGKMKGARFVLIGAITNYRVTKAKAQKGFDALGLVEVGGAESSLVYEVQVSSRIVDVETREVVAADAATSFKQKYSVAGKKVKVLGVGSESRETVDTRDESMGKVLSIAFAKSLNKVIDLANRHAGQYMAAPPQGQYQQQPPPQYQQQPQYQQAPPQQGQQPGYQPAPQQGQQPQYQQAPPQQQQGGYQPPPQQAPPPR